MKRKCSIYCFTNKLNNKKYIGSTVVEPNIRYNQHIYNATHNNTHQYNYPLYQAIRKYGIENFIFEILEQQDCEEEEIRLIEKNYILKYNTILPEGYNQTDNTLHPINSQESYIKMSETKRENAKRVAYVDNDNQIIQIWRSIIDCAKDLKLNEKHIASCCRGERKTTGEKKFYWLDEEDNLIIPEYKRNNYKGEKGTTQIQSSSRKVNKIDKNTNQILKTYDTLALAARENNCDSSGIAKVCRGIRKTCGGFKWSYYEENN